MKTPTLSKCSRFLGINALTLAALAILPAAVTQAADIFWSGGTASYTNAANWGGTVPGVADKAINDNGAGNAVQINVGDPDWVVNGILAGKSTGNGAFVQNGQTLNLSGASGRGAVRLGVTAGRSGSYTINDGTLTYNGDFNVGELGSATLNVNGGSISGGGNLAINIGSTLEAVTATYGGTNKSDYTWYEQGFFSPVPTRGIPAAGSTFVSETLADHSFTMPASYSANNAVQVFAGIPNATITFTAPVAADTLSLLGSSGFGTSTVNYTIHHADSTTQSGSLAVLDWFDNGGAVAFRAGGRSSANGLQLQDNGVNPVLTSFDITLANTTSPVTSIDLTHNGAGGVAAIMAVSSGVGGVFTPQAITGYNQDIVFGAAEQVYVASTVTNVLNQTAGTINITGEMFVGNVGAGIYNLSGGTNTVANWIGVGRSGGNGVINMTGGVLNKTGGGNLIFGTPYQNLPGHDVSGVLNHSGGTINVQSGQVWFPEASSTLGTVSGTYNLSGTAVMNVGDWFAIGRNGGSGSLNMTGGTINKTGGGQPAMIIADGGGAVGQVTHSAGTINCSSEFWIGQNGGSATYNLSGSGALNVTNWFAIGRAGNGANGALTMTGGSLNQGVNGVFIVGDNSQGSFLHSAGPATAREFWVGNGGSGNGNYDLSASASLAVSGYVVIGRDGFGQCNMSGGTFSKTTGDGYFIIASGGSGSLYQSGGSVVSTLSDTWVAENGTATWSLSGSGSATLSKLVLGLNSAGSGTFNLDGGTLTANEIAGGAGTSALNLNGGTLVAAANNANFLHGVTTATLASGGVTVDTAGFNVTVAQVLQDGGGALTKNGAGTLTLSAPNTYAGATTINAGGFGVLVTADNSQLSVGSANFSGATHSLDVDLNTFGSPGAAPLAIVGALNVNGAVTVNVIASGALQIGVYPLISSGSRSGAGTFVLGTLPLNTGATLVDNGTTVSLNITNVNAPRWEGLAGGNWDIGLTTNWINGGSGLPTYFSEGSEVLFNDEALGTTSVNLVATVHPSSVTFNNTNLSYTLSGSGKISGATGLAKQGTGTLTIANNNDFTGPTVVSAGVVSVTNLANAGSPSPIGSGNLVLAGGGLSYAGPAAAINRGYTVQGGGGTIETLNNLTLSGVANAAAGSGFTKSGPAQLAYTGVDSNYLAATDYRVRDGAVVLQGQTNRVQGTFSVAGVANAVAVLTNTTLIVNDNSVGDVAGSVGAMTMNEGTTLNVNSWFKLGDAANSVATFTLNGGTVNVPNGRLFLGSAPGTITTLNINGGVINQGGDNIRITDGGWNGTGARTGTVNQVSGTINCNGEFMIGQWGPSMGIYNLSGGVINQHNWMQIGRESGSGIFIMTGGTLNKDGNGHFIVADGQSDGNMSHGEFHMTGGTFNNSKELWVGQNGGIGVYNMTNGALNVHDWVAIGRDGGNGTFNLAGGTFTKDGNGDFLVAAGNGSIGVLNHSGGAIVSTKPFLVPQWGNSSTLGTYNLSGTGVCSVSDWVAIGRDGGNGVMNLSGNASFTKTGGGAFIVGASGLGELNQTGGTITNTVSDTWIAENNTGTWNLNGGSVVMGWVQFARNGSGIGTLNLNGGVFSATEFTCGGGLGTFNMNGGTIKARASNANFMHDLDAANVLAGGVTIDTETNSIGIAQALLDGGSGGGLIKTGTGTLQLNGVNTYTGTTLVNDGTLGGSGTIAGPVTIGAAAALAPGNSIGTLTVGNNLTLGSNTVMEVSKDGGVTASDRAAVTGNLAFGGTLTVVVNSTNILAVNDTFNLFDWGTRSGSFTATNLPANYTWDLSQLAVDGTIRVTGVFVAPTLNAPAYSGGNLIMTGSGGVPGGSYTWLTSTNVTAPAAEWTTNTAGLFDVTGSFSNALPVNPSEAARFFRLRVP